MGPEKNTERDSVLKHKEYEPPEKVVTLEAGDDDKHLKTQEIIASEPEAEFVSTLPDYDLPSKRDKTQLEVFEVPEHADKSRKKNEKVESEPDWERLTKKP